MFYGSQLCMLTQFRRFAYNKGICPEFGDWAIVEALVTDRLLKAVGTKYVHHVEPSTDCSNDAVQRKRGRKWWQNWQKKEAYFGCWWISLNILKRLIHKDPEENQISSQSKNSPTFSLSDLLLFHPLTDKHFTSISSFCFAGTASWVYNHVSLLSLPDGGNHVSKWQRKTFCPFTSYGKWLWLSDSYGVKNVSPRFKQWAVTW